MEQVMEAQADLQSALGLLRLNGWGQPQEDYLVRSLARLHGMLDALGSPMYDAETHSEVRVAPVGGGGEPDDERVVEKVEKALREAVIVEDGPGGERAMDFSLDRLARAAVAAVRAAGRTDG